jgi:hypothetical protein
MTVECEVSTSSTAGIKVIDTSSRHSVEDKSTVSNAVGPATQLYALCSDNLRIYRCSKYPDGCVGYHAFTWYTSRSRYFHSFTSALVTRLGAAPRIGIHSPRCWQHARGLHFESVFIRPGVGNTLGGCTSNWHSLTSVLATRSGAAPGLHSPGVSNTLGVCASHLFARR